MNGECLRSLGDVALAAGAFALGGVFGVKFAEGVLDLVGAGKDFALDLSDAQKQPLDDIRRRVEASIQSSYRTWLKESKSAGRTDADVEAALAHLPAAIQSVRPSIADLNLGDAAFAKTLLARLPPTSPCATTETGRAVFERLLRGVRTVAQLDPALQSHFALVRWEATLAAFGAAQADRDTKHSAQMAAIGDTQDRIDRVERLLQAMAAKDKPAKRTRAAATVPIAKLRPIFLATQRELPKATDADLVRHVKAAVEELLKRAEEKPQAFNDSREISDAIAVARQKLAEADTDGALQTLDGAFVKQVGDIDELEQLVAARKLGAARLKLEQAAILKISYRWDEALAAFAAAAQLAPDLAKPWLEIGIIHEDRGNLASARAAFQTAVTMAEKVGDDPALGAGYDRLGSLLMREGNLAAAASAFEHATTLAKRHLQADPDNVLWRRSLAVCHSKIGDIRTAEGNLTAARVAYENCLALTQALAKQDEHQLEWQRDLSISHNNIGDVLMAEGNLEGALEAYRRAHAIREVLGEQDKGRPEKQRDLAVSHSLIGYALKASGDLQGARQSYESDLAIAQTLANSDLGNTAYQRDLSNSLGRIGDLMMIGGHLPEARRSYEKALAITQALADRDTANAEWQHDLSVGHGTMGDVLMAEGNLPDARAAHSKCLAIIQALVASDGGNAGWQRDLSVAYDKLGDVLMAEDKRPDALKAFEVSLAICQQLAEKDSGNAEWQRDLIVSNVKLAELGDAPAARYGAALAIASRLASENRLSPDDLAMIPELERRLAALSSTPTPP